MSKEIGKKSVNNIQNIGLENNAVNYNRKIVFIVLISLLFFFLFDACLAQENITITNIWYKKMPNFTRVTIKANRPIEEYEAMYVDAPERIVIDVYDADYNITELVKNTLFLNMGSVKQVRCGQIEPDKARFVIDLFQQADYDMALDSTRHLLQINIYDYKEFLSPEQQIFTVEPLAAEEIKRIREQEMVMVPSLVVDQVTTPITMNLKETEVIDAIRTLSMLSGINIVADDSVTGQITLSLNEVSFKEALNWILKLKRLSYTQVGNALIVGTDDIIKTYRERITRIVHLENADVENTKSVLDHYFNDDDNIKITTDTRLNNLIVEGLPELVSKSEELVKEMDASLITKTFKLDNAFFVEEIESIQNMLGIIIPDESRILVDERQNEIIIKGNQEEIANAQIMIEGLDKRASQIMIESKIVEIELNAEKDLGISWGSGTDTEGNLMLGQISLGELTLGGSFERFGLVQAKLDALTREGKTNTLSNPKILTLDGKESIILSGSKIPIRERTAEGIETVRYIDVGLNMTITPRLTKDEKITMDCDIKVESLGSELIQGYPIINSRQEKAIIRSPLGITNVIGGLISSEEIETIRRIPILSEIPVFGELFKFTNRTKKRTEIIILITAQKIEQVKFLDRGFSAK
jgi:type II secretory pathway component GspD/PulD (secretin)